MIAVAAHVSCPLCGGRLDWVASGTTDGFRTAAVVRCAPCNTSYRLNATLTNLRTETKNLASMGAV